MSTQLNNATGSGGEASREWLGALLLRRGSTLMPRFVSFYHQIARRPRRLRRQLRRKLAVTVAGAALLLALAGGPNGSSVLAEPAAPDARIYVAYGEVAINDNGTCSLIEAIVNARATRAGQLHDDCVAGNLSGPDTVILPPQGLFVLTEPHNSVFGATGLPVITTDMTINGNGATIRRSDAAGTPDFRIMAVDPGVRLTLRDTTISNGHIYDENGGGIYSKGTLIVEGSTVTGNYGGAGGGIFAQTLTLTDSVVAGNIAHGGDDYGGWGGGINAGSGTISGSTISGNRADNGWDMFNYWDPVPGRGGSIFSHEAMTIVNSTISDNEANEGGGLFVWGETTLVQSTVSGNRARTKTGGTYNTTIGGDGGGVLVAAYWSACGTLTTRGSLISGNAADNPQGREVLVAETFDCTATATANAFNVFGHDSDAGLSGFVPGATDVVPAVAPAAVLSPLADNGGPTQTHALPPGSPALDLAPGASCAAAPVNGVDQRGKPRNANGAGGVSANECDAGSYERQAGGALLISPARKGNIGGLAFTPADILKYDPASGWSMYFDGRDVGVTRNLSAFEVLDNGDILMSFAANQKIDGVGTFAPQDIARFVPVTTGDNTAGSFQWQLDGSAYQLTTSGEKIDALAENPDGRIAVSTTGTASVSRPEGGLLKAQDEDALGFNFTLQRWSALFDGTAIPGLKGEDVNGMWIDPTTGDVYISILGEFNLGGIEGDGKDIVKLAADGAGGYTPRCGGTVRRRACR